MAQTDGYNSDIKSEQIQKLAELFPEAITEGKVNLEALKATLGEDVSDGEKYGLSWKGKSKVFAKIQEKTVSTLHPQPEESVDWDTTRNMFIEGDNLEALKVLHKAYYGKVKMIYIDPPYNTGNDFVYNDDFAKTRRQNAMDEGSLDEEGNATRDDGLRANTGGHKHSNWLDMMYPRLFLARNLLRQDGVIFVSIDDNEVHNLRLIMNEIFGEENFVAQISWQRKYGPANDAKYISETHEYILVFARNKIDWSPNLLKRNDKQLLAFQNPDNDPRGPWRASDFSARTKSETGMYPIKLPSGSVVHPPASRSWITNEKRFFELKNDNRIWFGVDGSGRPMQKKFLSEVKDGITPQTWWSRDFAGDNKTARYEIKSIFPENVFDTPKPITLMKRVLEVGSIKDDIVMDFFGGSGTLTHAAIELNAEDGGDRKWIMVQLPELTGEKSEARKAGYKTIAEISRERIRRAGVKISKDFADKIADREKPLDLGFRSYVLGDSNFKKWNELMADPEEIRQATLDQLNPIEDDATDDGLLTEILLKRGISPLVELERCTDFIFIPSESLAISLSRNMTEELFAQILAKSPSQIILLDQAFRDDVNLKTNLILQAEKQNIVVEVL